MVYMVMSLSSEDCSSLIRDNYIQRTLQTFEEDEEELDERSHTENILKYLDDMCGWIPDTNIQYRRQPNDKVKGKTVKPDWGSLSRRTGRHDSKEQVIDYEFKHYTNLRKYIEQYRRFHTCGGPLEKLSQSAYGRTKTVYYTNGNESRQADTTSKSAERRSDTGPRSKPSSKHLPDAPKGSLVKYHDDLPSSPPKYQSLTDVVLRKRSEASHNLGNYTNNGWSNIPPGVVSGEPPPQKTTSSNKDTPMQWTINEHGLTIYHHDKSSTVFRHKGPSHNDLSSDTNHCSKYPSGSQPQTSFLPFFTPTQHSSGSLQSKNRQLSPPNVPAPTLPVSSGFSIDRTINNSRSSTTGATHDQDSLLQDLYSQLVHAAVNLQLKKNMELKCTPLTDYRFIQKHLNLSPLRTKLCDDSASTCSSHGSRKKRRSKVKGRDTPSKVKNHSTSTVQEHYPSNSAVPSTQGHAKVNRRHDASIDQQSSLKSASASKITLKASSAFPHIESLRIQSRHNTAPASRGELTSDDKFPTECASSYRVRLNDSDYQRPLEIDKKVALCEATFF